MTYGCDEDCCWNGLNKLSFTQLGNCLGCPTDVRLERSRRCGDNGEERGRECGQIELPPSARVRVRISRALARIPALEQ